RYSFRRPRCRQLADGQQRLIRSGILNINSEMQNHPQKGEYSCAESRLALNGRLALWIAGFIVASSNISVAVFMAGSTRKTHRSVMLPGSAKMSWMPHGLCICHCCAGREATLSAAITGQMALVPKSSVRVVLN